MTLDKHRVICLGSQSTLGWFQQGQSWQISFWNHCHKSDIFRGNVAVLSSVLPSKEDAEDKEGSWTGALRLWARFHRGPVQVWWCASISLSQRKNRWPVALCLNSSQEKRKIPSDAFFKGQNLFFQSTDIWKYHSVHTISPFSLFSSHFYLFVLTFIRINGKCCPEASWHRTTTPGFWGASCSER